MTPVTVGVIGIATMLILMLLRMPIGFAMMLVGFVGFAYLRNLEGALGLLGVVPVSTFMSYGLSVIPLFVLMGTFCFYSRLSRDLYDGVFKWLGHLPGGLAMASVGACAGFSAICGSSIATAATIGMVALPEMKRHNYDPALATGCVAAGGTMGILIPPSVGLVLVGIITGQSIGKLFLAGVIPGILQAAFYIVTIYIICKLNPSMGPPGPRSSFKEKITSIKDTWVIIVLFLLVIGGLYLGVFSPTEAAGIGAFAAFIFGIAKKQLGWQRFKDSVIETGITTAMLMVILAGAMMLNGFLAASKLPATLSDWVSTLSINREIIFIAIFMTYVALGCVMESLSIMLLITPIFYPLIVTLGFDPIWFGILITRAGEIGMITPPVGLTVFVISALEKDVPMYTIFRGIIPFLIADFFEVAFLIAFPEITLFLPKMMK